MNIEAYISSGILEAYVLDQLTMPEREAVEKMITEYPKIKAELQTLEEDLLAFAQKGAIAPPTASKENLFNAIDFAPEEEKTVVKTIARGNPFYKYLSIAASLVAIVAVGFGLHFKNQWEATSSRLEEVLAENQQIADNFSLTKDKADRYAKELEFLQQPDIKTISMKGLDPAPTALAYVHWNTKSHQVLLNIQKLPIPDSGKQYQLWAIVDGKPVDAGIFNMPEGEGNLIQMKTVAKPAAFAITLEPQGGSVSPTLDQMYLMGEVQLPS